MTAATSGGSAAGVASAAVSGGGGGKRGGEGGHNEEGGARMARGGGGDGGGDGGDDGGDDGDGKNGGFGFDGGGTHPPSSSRVGVCGRGRGGGAGKRRGGLASRGQRWCVGRALCARASLCRRRAGRGAAGAHTLRELRGLSRPAPPRVPRGGLEPTLPADRASGFRGVALSRASPSRSLQARALAERAPCPEPSMSVERLSATTCSERVEESLRSLRPAHTRKRAEKCIRLCDSSRGVFESKHTPCLLDEASTPCVPAHRVHLLGQACTFELHGGECRPALSKQDPDRQRPAIFRQLNLASATLEALGRPTVGLALITKSGPGAHFFAWAAQGCVCGPARGVVGREAQPGRHRRRAGRWHWRRVAWKSPRLTSRSEGGSQGSAGLGGPHSDHPTVSEPCIFPHASPSVTICRAVSRVVLVGLVASAEAGA